MNSVSSNNKSFKYQSFELSSCKVIGIGKFEFVAKTQFLCQYINVRINNFVFIIIWNFLFPWNLFVNFYKFFKCRLFNESLRTNSLAIHHKKNLSAMLHTQFNYHTWSVTPFISVKVTNVFEYMKKSNAKGCFAIIPFFIFLFFLLL